LTLYLDTSVLVAALTREPRSGAVLAWLDAQQPDQLTISEWVVTEFSSALSIKLRTGQITATERAEALSAFACLCAEGVTVLPISGLHFRMAARIADQHTLGLRAGDALHLAICADHGAALHTLDRRLSEAGPALGVQTATL
jgi:predicted nucleic acid-binding protein